MTLARPPERSHVVADPLRLPVGLGPGHLGAQPLDLGDEALLLQPPRVATCRSRPGNTSSRTACSSSGRRRPK